MVRVGLINITIHPLLCMIVMLVIALAALTIKQVEKAKSITMLER